MLEHTNNSYDARPWVTKRAAFQRLGTIIDPFDLLSGYDADEDALGPPYISEV